jgi:hypothetical protein
MSAHSGSRCSWLATFEIGERRYIETTPERATNDMQHSVPHVSRRPEPAKSMTFSRQLFTACSHSAHETRTLICVERIS